MYLICSSFFILSIPFFFVFHPPEPGQSKATAWFVGPGIRCCCKNKRELKLSMDHAFSNHSNLAFLPWESVAPLPFHLYPRPRFEGEKMKSVSKVLGYLHWEDPGRSGRWLSLIQLIHQQDTFVRPDMASCSGCWPWWSTTRWRKVLLPRGNWWTNCSKRRRRLKSILDVQFRFSYIFCWCFYWFLPRITMWFGGVLRFVWDAFLCHGRGVLSSQELEANQQRAQGTRWKSGNRHGWTADPKWQAETVEGGPFFYHAERVGRSSSIECMEDDIAMFGEWFAIWDWVK